MLRAFGNSHFGGGLMSFEFESRHFQCSPVLEARNLGAQSRQVIQRARKVISSIKESVRETRNMVAESLVRIEVSRFIIADVQKFLSCPYTAVSG